MTDEQIDLRGVFGILRRQARLILGTIGLFVLAAIAFLLLVTPIYTATTLVLVDPLQKNLLDPGRQSTVPGTSDNARVASEVEILKSTAVALDVVLTEDLVSDREFGVRLGLAGRIKTALGVAPEADGEALARQVVQRFQRATDIRRRGPTYLISVSVSSVESARAAELANSVTAAYIRQQVSGKIDASLAARDVLEAQIQAARDELSDTEDALDKFISANLEFIEEEAGRTDITGLRTLIGEARHKLGDTRSQLSVIRAGLREGDWREVVKSLGNDALAKLADDRARLQSQLGQASSGSELERDLQAELQRIDTALTAETQRQIDGLRVDIAAFSAAEAEARQDLREILFEGRLPTDFLAEIYEIQQEASIARSQYQNLLSRLREVEVQAGVQLADSRVVSPALPPNDPSFPNATWAFAIALLMGSGTGVLAALFREFITGGFVSGDQLQDATQIPVASVIPYEPQGQEDAAILADRVVSSPLSAYAESYRRLRVSIDQSLRSRPDFGTKGASVILVTSTLPEEGKSTTALGLARTYANSGKRAVLIDGDLRKPAIHKFLGLEPHGGFLDFLKARDRNDPFEDFSGKDPKSPLTVILGKSRSDIPTDQMLASGAFEEFVEGVRGLCDVIIIDSSPLLPVVDARYIAQWADVTIVVVRAAATNASDLRNALTELRAALPEESLLFTALSQSTETSARYYY